jgi:hypothetical protein
MIGISAFIEIVLSGVASRAAMDEAIKLLFDAIL